MAKQARNTFGELSSTLQSLGFVRSKRGGSVVFAYPGGGPIILLPAYKSEDTVRPIHRAMVSKQLTDSGIVKARASSVSGYAKAASKTRPALKAKCPAKSAAPKRRAHAR